MDQAKVEATRNSFPNLLKNTAWAILSSAFLVITGFVVNILLGNKLGEAGYGVYSITTSIYILVGMVLFLGVPVSLTKYSAEFIDDHRTSAQYFSASVLVVLVSTISGSLLLFSVRHFIANIFHISELIQFIPVLCIGLPFYGFYKVGLGRLNGLREMRKMAAAEIMRYILFSGLTIGFLHKYPENLFLPIVALVISDISSFPYMLWATQIRKNWDLGYFFQISRRIGWFGSRVILTRIFEELDVRSNLLLVGMLLTKIDAGLYSLASLIATGISVLPNAIQKVTGPVMTDMYIKSKIGELENLVNQTMKTACFILTTMTCILVLFFSNIIRILYPNQPGFLEAESVFQILAFGSVLFGTTITINPIFLSIDRPDITFKIGVIRFIVSVFLTVLFIGPFGINGAAIGGAGTGILVFGFWTYYMNRLININVNWKLLLVIPIAGIGLVAVAKLLSNFLHNEILLYGIWLILLLIFSIGVIQVLDIKKLLYRLVNMLFGRKTI